MNVSDAELVEAYFSLLTDAEIERLYKIYKLDFKQFEYSFKFRGREYNPALWYYELDILDVRRLWQS